MAITSGVQKAAVLLMALDEDEAASLLSRIPARTLRNALLAESQPTEFHSIVQACKQSPNATVCLLSALRIHDLTTQSPFEVWLAIGAKDRKPQMSYPPIRIVRFSGASRGFGIEKRKIEGVTVSVYSTAKTIADCFKYRNKIGIDVAIEALKDCRSSREATIDQLWEAAKVCRMANVMRPYLEATS